MLDALRVDAVYPWDAFSRPQLDAPTGCILPVS